VAFLSGSVQRRAVALVGDRDAAMRLQQEGNAVSVVIERRVHERCVEPPVLGIDRTTVEHKHRHNGDMSCFSRVMQGGLTPFILCVDVTFLFVTGDTCCVVQPTGRRQQRVNDLQVTFPACEHEGGVSVDVLSVDVTPSPQQTDHALVVAPTRGIHEGVALPVIHPRHLTATLQQKSHYLWTDHNHQLSARICRIHLLRSKLA